MTTKTLGQIAHETGERVEGWARRWVNCSDSQKDAWEQIAKSVIEARADRQARQEPNALLLAAVQAIVAAEDEADAARVSRDINDESKVIEDCAGLFKKTGSSLYAIRAFRAATSAKLYPPRWVLDFMNDRFARFLDDDVSLDRAFGFTREGTGQRGKWSDPKTANAIAARDEALCLFVFKLEGVGLTRPQACKAISGLLSRLRVGQAISFHPDFKGALGGMDITGKGIAKAVNLIADDYQSEAKITANAAINWTDVEKRQTAFFVLSFRVAKKISVHVPHGNIELEPLFQFHTETIQNLTLPINPQQRGLKGNQMTAETSLPRLATIDNAAKAFADAGQTANAIRANIFKADDRFNSRGEKIKGNGLAATGAIIRRGRRVLVDLDRYGSWLAGAAK